MIKLMYLGAEWCGPCKKMKPVIDEFEKENPEVMVVRIDVDEDSNTAFSLEISSIPTIIVMKDNTEVARKIGPVNKSGLIELVYGKKNEE